MSQEDFQLTNSPRRTYLITYSQIDKEKFPTRESFAVACAKAFTDKTSKATVVQYACCLELHSEGGEHYHVCLKLSGPKRWVNAKNWLMNTYSISVHFQDEHNFYIAAYRYVTKEDTKVYHSPGHPPLHNIASPKTKKCIAQNRKRASCSSTVMPTPKTQSTKPGKQKRRRL